MIEWDWKAFEALSLDELYEILLLRQQVFILEQQCFYNDIDDLDRVSHHLIGWGTDEQGSRRICAYLRVFPPGVKFPEISIGRVLVAQHARGGGLGAELMTKAVEIAGREFACHPIKISAQTYLTQFYTTLGFEPISEPYDEDGIQHIDMLRKPN